MRPEEQDNKRRNRYVRMEALRRDNLPAPAVPQRRVRPHTLRQAKASSSEVNAYGRAVPGGGPAAMLLAKPRRPGLRPRMLALIVLAAAVITAAALGITAWASAPRPVPAHEVRFDGRAIGLVADTALAEQAMGQIVEDLKSTFGMDIALGQSLSFSPVLADKQNLCTKEQVAQAIRQHIDVKVKASVIVVNDRPAVALRTAQEARQALDAVLAPFEDAAPSRNRTDIAFVENVQVVDMPIDYSLVAPAEQASRTLSLGAGVEDNWVEVQKGDSLSRIAKKFKLKVSDLRRANPSLASTDVIQPGDRVNAVKPAKWLNVRFTETITREEALPYKTVEQPDDTLYTSQKSVKQEGKKGVREVIARITYINGMEAQKDILSETVIEAAQDRIVLRGTKKVPTNLDNGGTGTGTAGSSGFLLPINTYRLTSTFRLRTLGGVTRWHYGLDLAAPTGTPIYATKNGTVSFSGSSSGYGLLVKLDHGGGYESRYGHCSKLLVKKGQQVKRGQIIALVGSTGHSTGPHCHFEIRVNGTPQNPEKYVRVKK